MCVCLSLSVHTVCYCDICIPCVPSIYLSLWCIARGVIFSLSCRSDEDEEETVS